MCYYKIFVFIISIILLNSSLAFGQNSENKKFDFGFDYTTEIQSNLKKSNWANQLHLNITANLNNNLHFNLRTLSLAKTRTDAVVEDLQVFSNLIEKNVTAAIACAAFEWNINENNTLYAGIHNMNDDYFASDVTALFTNSSCGIFPTLSSNFTAANFPYASVGIHYSYNNEKYRFLASIYNGQGYNRFSGKENIYRFCPKSDGVYALSQLEYKNGESSYFVGANVHYGSPDGFLDKKARSVFWTYGEQKLSSKVSLIFDYSHAFDKELSCTEFVGFGGKIDLCKTEIGLFTDYAKFSNEEEFASELTCKVSLNEHFYMQPSLHFIHCDKSQLVGLLRLGVEF